MGGVTPGPRQFTMMAPGTQAGNAVVEAPWEVRPVDAPGAIGYSFSTKLDLRGLVPEGMAKSDSKGLAWDSIALQEAGPWDMAGDESETAFIIYDLFTTVALTENTMRHIFSGLGVPGVVPGFLAPTTFIQAAPDSLYLNPSQVIWGLWRMMAMNRNLTLGLDFATQPAMSSYMGEGEVSVGPECHWTRFMVGVSIATQIICPSANLTCRAAVVKLTEAQEMTQMMRGVAR